MSFVTFVAKVGRQFYLPLLKHVPYFTLIPNFSYHLWLFPVLIQLCNVSRIGY